MTVALRNSLWNYLLKTIFACSPDLHPSVSKPICERSFRLPLDSLPGHYSEHRTWLRIRFFYQGFPWYEVHNLIEFIAKNCGQMRSGLKPSAFREGANKILEEEMSAYRFIGDVLVPISTSDEVQSITGAVEVASVYNLYGAKEHLSTAVDLMSKKPSPDYRNSIKESISAIECLAKQITGEENGGLDRALSKLDKQVHFHGASKAGMLSLYGYTSDEDGIRHAILEKADIGFEEAKFMLVSCSALVNLLVSKASKYGLL